MSLASNSRNQSIPYVPCKLCDKVFTELAQLGRFSHRVAMSVEMCHQGLSLALRSHDQFQASYWSYRASIGHASIGHASIDHATILLHAWSPKKGGWGQSVHRPRMEPSRGRVDASTAPFFSFFFLINHATSRNLYWSYYPHRSRELVSPVCGIFLAGRLF